ncbi:MAG: nucleotidyltransferase family protein [Bacteroidia bacterium]
MISCIVLAAGLSRRMGEENKLLLPFRGQALISRILGEVVDAGVGEVIAVTGFEPQKVRAAAQNSQVRWVHNQDYINGMTTSIQAGVAASSTETEGFMICLGDQPLITASEYRDIATMFSEQKKNRERYIQVPVFEGKRGNPVIFSSTFREEILAHSEMEGCREIILSNQPFVHYFTFPNSHIISDIDTPDDYKRL